MSTDFTTKAPTTRPEVSRSGSKLFAAVSKAAVSALIANLLIFTVAKLAGVQFTLTPPGAAAMDVQIFSIALMTIATMLVGGFILLLLVKFTRLPAAQFMAWAGLAVGVLTVVMPLSMDGETTVRFLLAAMHVITGLAWFIMVRRTVTK